MGSTKQQDRSLGSGISLPQWMKGKIDNKFDFDESTFSPPSHDDSFFYVRYSKAKQPQPSVLEELRPLEEALNEKKVGPSTNRGKTEERLVSGSKEVQEVDFSKHSLSCQPLITTTAAVNEGNEVKPLRNVASAYTKAKSQGTDDGIHGEAALCGKSIVQVANQMMSNKFGKMFAAEQEGRPPKKGSKSLPATPLTSPVVSPDSSPKARRRIPSNRYFTGPFVPDREKYQGGWILASILGQSREIVTAKIEEEDESNMDVPVPPRSLSRKKSISSQNLSYVGSDEKASRKSTAHGNVFQAKPSELREMNFWSPTSM